MESKKLASILSAVFRLKKSQIFSCFVILFITPIFIEAFSPFLFKDSTSSFTKEARFIFFITTLLGQISFPILSGIDSGCIILPVLELVSVSGEIVEKCRIADFPFKNALLCHFLGCILCFVFSLIIHATGQGKSFAMIPMNIVDALTIMAALANLRIGFSWFNIGDHITSYTILLSGVSLGLTIIGISVMKLTGNPKMLVLFAIVIICVFNLLKIYFEPTFLVENKIFITQKAEPLCFDLLKSHIISGAFDFKVIKLNLKEIITMGITPLISFSTSLPFYARMFDITPKYNRELLSLGISNLVSSLGCFPVNFNSVGSMMFRLCGATGKEHSIAGGISLVVIYYIHHLITPFIPTFTASFMSLFIGLSVMIGYLESFSSMTMLDRTILVLTCLIAFYFKSNVVATLLACISLTMVISLYFTRRFISRNNTVTIEEIDGSVVIKVDGSLDCRNVHGLTTNIEKFQGDVIFNLKDAIYVDYTANTEVDKVLACCTKKKRSVRFVGTPANLKAKTVS